MNGSIIRKILGYVLLLEGALLLLPCLVALYYGEKQGITYLICAGATLLLGLIVGLKKAKNTDYFS